MTCLWGFATEYDLWFVRSELKLILHCIAQLFILEKSIFNRLVDSVVLWTTENSDVSSAKSLAFQIKLLAKSLMEIKNIKGQRADPWGMPAFKYAYDECWPFNTTLSFLQRKKSFIKVISSPNIPYCCNFKRKSSCPNLSNALNISRRTPLTSLPSSNADKISCAISSIWLVQKSPGPIPDCFGDIKSFSEKTGKHVIIKFKHVTANQEKRNWTIIFMHCLSPFFKFRNDVCLFHSEETLPELKKFWKITSSGFHMGMTQSFTMRMLIISRSWGLL